MLKVCETNSSVLSSLFSLVHVLRDSFFLIIVIVCQSFISKFLRWSWRVETYPRALWLLHLLVVFPLHTLRNSGRQFLIKVYLYPELLFSRHVLVFLFFFFWNKWFERRWYFIFYLQNNSGMLKLKFQNESVYHEALTYFRTYFF